MDLWDRDIFARVEGDTKRAIDSDIGKDEVGCLEKKTYKRYLSDFTNDDAPEKPSTPSSDSLTVPGQTESTSSYFTYLFGTHGIVPPTPAANTGSGSGPMLEPTTAPTRPSTGRPSTPKGGGSSSASKASASSTSSSSSSSTPEKSTPAQTRPASSTQHHTLVSHIEVPTTTGKGKTQSAGGSPGSSSPSTVASSSLKTSPSVPITTANSEAKETLGTTPVERKVTSVDGQMATDSSAAPESPSELTSELQTVELTASTREAREMDGTASEEIRTETIVTRGENTVMDTMHTSPSGDEALMTSEGAGADSTVIGAVTQLAEITNVSPAQNDHETNGLELAGSTSEAETRGSEQFSMEPREVTTDKVSDGDTTRATDDREQTSGRGSSDALHSSEATIDGMENATQSSLGNETRSTNSMDSSPVTEEVSSEGTSQMSERQDSSSSLETHNTDVPTESTMTPSELTTVEVQEMTSTTEPTSLEPTTIPNTTASVAEPTTTTTKRGEPVIPAGSIETTGIIPMVVPVGQLSSEDLREFNLQFAQSKADKMMTRTLKGCRVEVTLIRPDGVTELVLPPCLPIISPCPTEKIGGFSIKSIIGSCKPSQG